MSFFDSYEPAIENDTLPETSVIAERYDALVEGVLAFQDLDLLESRT